MKPANQDVQPQKAGVNRRGVFRILQAGAAVGAVAPAAQARVADDQIRHAPKGASAMLYDTTLCIGCKACVTACNEGRNRPC